MRHYILLRKTMKWLLFHLHLSHLRIVLSGTIIEHGTAIVKGERPAARVPPRIRGWLAGKPQGLCKDTPYLSCSATPPALAPTILRSPICARGLQQTAIDIVQVLWYCYCRVSFPCCLPCTHAFLLRQCVGIVVVCFLLAPFDSASPIMVIPAQACYHKGEAWLLQEDTERWQEPHCCVHCNVSRANMPRPQRGEYLWRRCVGRDVPKSAV